MVINALYVACPDCAQQPGQPCIWATPQPHSFSHASRFEVAASIAAMKASRRGVVTRTDLVDEAFATVVDEEL